MISVFSCPSRYTQGPDATERLGEEIASLDARARLRRFARTARNTPGGRDPA